MPSFGNVTLGLVLQMYVLLMLMLMRLLSRGSTSNSPRRATWRT